MSGALALRRGVRNGVYAPYKLSPTGWIKPSAANVAYQSGSRASPGTACASGDTCGLLLDISGNNYEFTQSGTSRPTFNVSGGETFLTFDNVDDWMQCTTHGLSATGYPFTIGMKVRSPAATTEWSVFACYKDTGSNDRFDMGFDSSGVAYMEAFTGTSGWFAATTPLTNDAWIYMICRYISSTNRRLSVLYPNGTTEHAQGTTSKALSSLDTLYIGRGNTTATNPLAHGDMMEMWWKDADIQSGGGQLSDSLLKQIAYGGITT